MMVVMSVSPIALGQSLVALNSRLMLGQQLLELRLLHRSNVVVDLFDEHRIGIDADNVVALGREHSRDRRAKLSQSDDRDLHSRFPRRATPSISRKLAEFKVNGSGPEQQAADPSKFS